MNNKIKYNTMNIRIYLMNKYNINLINLDIKITMIIFHLIIIYKKYRK